MMQDKGSDCFDIIVQLKAVRSAISSLMDKLAGEEFSSCLCKSDNKNKLKMQKIVTELIKNK